MDLRVEPLKLEELDEYIEVYWNAFSQPSANMPHPLIYPKDLKPDVVDRLRNRMLAQTNYDLGSCCFCAKTAISGQIVGISWWELVEDPPRTKMEIDAKFDEASAHRKGEPPVEGINSDLDAAFFRAAFYSEMETVNGRPYMSLRRLATHPKNHRQGVASLLMKQGLGTADQLKLPVYLATGVNGKPLYERFGFEVVVDIPLNCLDYGGQSDGRHWCMWRPARGGSETV